MTGTTVQIRLGRSACTAVVLAKLAMLLQESSALRVAPPASILLPQTPVLTRSNVFTLKRQCSYCWRLLHRQLGTIYYKSSKPGAGFGSFPVGAIFTGHDCRRVCVLYIKRLPGGNSGVQWLLALIPSPSPRCVLRSRPWKRLPEHTLHCHNTVALSHLTYQSLYGNKCHQTTHA